MHSWLKWKHLCCYCWLTNQNKLNKDYIKTVKNEISSWWMSTKPWISHSAIAKPPFETVCCPTWIQGCWSSAEADFKPFSSYLCYSTILWIPTAKQGDWRLNSFIQAGIWKRRVPTSSQELRRLVWNKHECLQRLCNICSRNSSSRVRIRISILCLWHIAESIVCARARSSIMNLMNLNQKRRLIFLFYFFQQNWF